MFNNGWKIEVYKSGGGQINRQEFDRYKGADDYYCNNYYGNREVIPIEEYAGSEDAPEEEKIAHLMNWKEKEKLKKQLFDNKKLWRSKFDKMQTDLKEFNEKIRDFNKANDETTLEDEGIKIAGKAHPKYGKTQSALT